MLPNSDPGDTPHPMQDLFAVLPMAVVMVAGPQIVTAILLATSERARRDSAFFLLGAGAAVTAGVSAAYWLSRTVKIRALPAGAGATRAIDLAIVGLLLFLAWRVLRERRRAQPPHWMAKLETASPSFALRLGLLLFLLSPSDIVAMATVGAYVAHHDQPWWHCLPFAALTVVLAGLPLVLLLALGRKGARILPAARSWMTRNSWVVSEVVIAFFLAMVLKELI